MVAINDRVKETTTTTGQGTVDLGGAKTGFVLVERIGNGNQTIIVLQQKVVQNLQE